MTVGDTADRRVEDRDTGRGRGGGDLAHHRRCERAVHEDYETIVLTADDRTAGREQLAYLPVVHHADPEDVDLVRQLFDARGRPGTVPLDRPYGIGL